MNFFSCDFDASFPVCRLLNQFWTTKTVRNWNEIKRRFKKKNWKTTSLNSLNWKISKLNWINFYFDWFSGEKKKRKTSQPPISPNTHQIDPNRPLFERRKTFQELKLDFGIKTKCQPSISISRVCSVHPSSSFTDCSCGVLELSSFTVSIYLQPWVSPFFYQVLFQFTHL